MIRVWMSLVGSMTVGALLLSWLEGAPDTFGRALSPEARVAQARGAVADCDNVATGWRGIALVGIPRTRDPMALIAVRSKDVVRPQDDVHFTLSTTSGVVASESWHGQRVLGRDRDIRIGVVPATESGGANPDQLHALQMLIAALNDAVADDGSTGVLPVHVEPSTGGRNPAGVLARQLAELVSPRRG